MSGCVVTDTEYPVRVAYSLLNKCMAGFEKLYEEKWQKIDTDQTLEPEFMATEMKEYANPSESDKITKIQKNLDDIKDIMSKNIDEVLKRGETLDSLMEKSEDLSASSKIFYKKAKDTNACCK
jgi:synaptobrevin family protein YKT6